MSHAVSPPVSRSRADIAMRRLLRLPAVRTGSEEAAHRAFSTSILVSATRCLLTYIVFPFVAPALGLAAGVGPALGVVIGVVAITCNVLSIRRFWRADHRWRWAFTCLSTVVIVMMVVLLVHDVTDLVT